MTHFTTPHTTLPPFAPSFGGRTPPSDATIWALELDAQAALELLAQIEPVYHESQAPRIAGMLQANGALTLYVWPRFIPDSALLITLMDHGAPYLADLACHMRGEAWIDGAHLRSSLIALSALEEKAARA